MPSQEQISKELENMYGASFDCGIDKTGDNHILKFYLEAINDEYLPQKEENMLKTSIETTKKSLYQFINFEIIKLFNKRLLKKILILDKVLNIFLKPFKKRLYLLIFVFG